MDAPFSFPLVQSYVLYLEPFLNSYYKEYQNIITIDKVPVGPLSPYVKHVNQPKLSPFHTVNPMDPIENCTFAIVRYPSGNNSLKNSNYFLTEKDVPSLLAFIQTSGYTIDYNMTKLIQRAKISPSSSKSKNMICSFSFQ
jgi:hypothetical protein